MEVKKNISENDGWGGRGVTYYYHSCAKQTASVAAKIVLPVFYIVGILKVYCSLHISCTNIITNVIDNAKLLH